MYNYYKTYRLYLTKETVVGYEVKHYSKQNLSSETGEFAYVWVRVCGCVCVCMFGLHW